MVRYTHVISYIVDMFIIVKTFYVIILFYFKIQPSHFKADGLFNKITYYHNFRVE